MALTEAIQEYLEKLYWFEEAGIEPTQANLARAMGVLAAERDRDGAPRSSTRA